MQMMRPTIGKYIWGMTASLIILLAGGWLILASFALGYQPYGVDWVSQTMNDFWVGIPVAVVALAEGGVVGSVDRRVLVGQVVAVGGGVAVGVGCGGQVVIPVVSEIKGRVTKLSEPRRIAGKPTIGLRPESVTLPNGHQFALSAVLVDTSLRDGSDVNEEGQFKGPGHDRHDTRETLVGAGGGVLIGALAGGAKGGVIGAGIGAGATVVHWFIKRRSATLPAGTELVMELSRPVVVMPMVATVAAGGGR